jgi:hypothetical protein
MGVRTMSMTVRTKITQRRPRAGEADIPGLTDEHTPRSRGPKRANKIRKLYNLGKDDDVRQAAKLHGKTVEKNGKTFTKTVKIQRLVTPTTLQRKRHRAALKKAKIEKARPLCPPALTCCCCSHCPGITLWSRAPLDGGKACVHACVRLNRTSVVIILASSKDVVLTSELHACRRTPRRRSTRSCCSSARLRSASAAPSRLPRSAPRAWQAKRRSRRGRYRVPGPHSACGSVGQYC